MNSWQKEFGAQGLVVVGVTNEPSSLVEKDVEKSKFEHPTVMVSGEETDRVYGIKAFPSGFLVDAEGVVVWAGHPGELDDDTLKKALGGVVVSPPLSEEHKAIDELRRSRKYGKAHAALLKALAKSPDDAELKAAADHLVAQLDRRMQGAKQALDAGEYGRAMKLYQEVTDDFAGMPGADEAKPAAAALKKDKAAADDLAAAAKLEDAEEKWIEGDLEKALDAYASIAKKYPDTPSGKRAEEMVQRH